MARSSHRRGVVCYGAKGVSGGGRDIGPCITEGCDGQRRVAFTNGPAVVVCSRCAFRGPVDWLAIHAEMTRTEAA